VSAQSTDEKKVFIMKDCRIFSAEVVDVVAQSFADEKRIAINDVYKKIKPKFPQVETNFIQYFVGIAGAKWISTGGNRLQVEDYTYENCTKYEYY
jgi:hypothetical protein